MLESAISAFMHRYTVGLLHSRSYVRVEERRVSRKGNTVICGTLYSEWESGPYEDPFIHEDESPFIIVFSPDGEILCETWG